MLLKGQLPAGMGGKGSCMRAKLWLSQTLAEPELTQSLHSLCKSISERTSAQQVFILRLMSPWLLIPTRQRLLFQNI